MRKRINPETDACQYGHRGNWIPNGLYVCCGTCKRLNERRHRQIIKKRMTPLRLAYEAYPGAAEKAAKLLHVPLRIVRDSLNGWRFVSRWRVTQLKAVLELCILTNGNGHKA